MNPQSRWSRTVALVGLLTVAPAAVAAAEPADGSDGSGPPADPVVFTVRPAMRFPAVLPPPQRPAERPMPPPALDEDRRIASVRELFGATGEEAVRLTPSQPADPAVGHLLFESPYLHDPLHGVALHTDPAGSTILRLNARAGYGYLVDFAVNGWARGEYLLSADGQSHRVPDDGSPRHVLVGLRAASAGWINVRLSREESGYYLHGVEVTPVPPAGAGGSD